MTPKEKAQELLIKFYHHDIANITSKKQAFSDAKECALIAVDEIMETYEEINPSHYITGYKTAEDFNDNLMNINKQLESRRINRMLYWEQVRNEIEKL